MMQVSMEIFRPKVFAISQDPLDRSGPNSSVESNTDTGVVVVNYDVLVVAFSRLLNLSHIGLLNWSNADRLFVVDVIPSLSVVNG